MVLDGKCVENNDEGFVRGRNSAPEGLMLTTRKQTNSVHQHAVCAYSSMEDDPAAAQPELQRREACLSKISKNHFNLGRAGRTRFSNINERGYDVTVARTANLIIIGLALGLPI